MHDLLLSFSENSCIPCSVYILCLLRVAAQYSEKLTESKSLLKLKKIFVLFQNKGS